MIRFLLCSFTQMFRFFDLPCCTVSTRPNDRVLTVQHGMWVERNTYIGYTL
ncbi:hypothetical protein PR003_g23243 [Phytophthora rubi]|uniref:Uncharacterized protein n=1 Tax=Phytophthora rubi TaxID=129364 RepID=A0A6A4CX00_9STRA|nr:hypothetical protein PR002_g22512 [Phytophthora rubi]KAE9298418.1 hypothetical protein PR003_g23243 [Phytophthora rubi]